MARSHAKGWPPTGFGAALRRERTKIGMTREQLAVKADCAFQTLVKLENGYQEPGWPLVLALAKALNVGVEAFAQVDPEDIEQKRPVGRPKNPNETPAPSSPSPSEQSEEGSKPKRRRKQS